MLLTIGDRRDPAELGPLPRRVRVERWVAQDEVMPRAAAVVGHGGSGSTLTALAAGVPLALVPLFVDGPENARRVAGAGAAIVVDDATALATAVRELLDDASYVEAARRIADDIRALPPVDAAVEVLTSYGSTRSSAIGFRASSNSISKMPSIVALKKIRVVSPALTSFMMS